MKRIAICAVSAVFISLAAGAGNVVKRANVWIRDPFVLADGGTYYLYESKPWSGGKGVAVRTSTNLEDWSEKHQAMKVPEGVPVTAVWAPEVHKYAGAYWMFVTITEAKGARVVASMVPGQEKHLQPRGVWVFKAASPLGPFEPVKAGPVTPPDWMTLDGTLVVDGGKPYMVFCHEWCQVKDGRMCMAPLAEGFASFESAPVTMFEASKAMDGAHFVTDGPYFYRSPKGGALFMIWSNMVRGRGYSVLVRRSESGRLAGPWSRDEILYGENGGHGMIFRTFDGRLMLALHQPNRTPDERMRLFALEDEGARLRLAAGDNMPLGEAR